MSVRGLAVAAVVVVVGAGGGCGSGALSFCVETAKASCHVQFECCTATERVATFGHQIVSFGPYTDEGGCVDAFTRQCEVASQVQDESVALKRQKFDADKAQKCVDDLKTASDKCDANSFFNRDSNCDNIFTGLVEDGGKCTSDRECKE